MDAKQTSSDSKIRSSNPTRDTLPPSIMSTDEEVVGAKPEAMPDVNSFNEWDPLEEVIVGILEGAVELCWEPGLDSVVPFEQREELKTWHLERGGKPFFKQQLVQAQKELDEFVNILPF